MQSNGSAFAEPRLGSEVEAVEMTHKRKARQPDAHLDTALILVNDLAFAEQRRRLANFSSRRPTPSIASARP
jgi:hypothetical protein